MERVVYFDLGGGYLGVYIHEKSLNYTLCTSGSHHHIAGRKVNSGDKGDNTKIYQPNTQLTSLKKITQSKSLPHTGRLKSRWFKSWYQMTPRIQGC
jgi:hypothetical protein